MNKEEKKPITLDYQFDSWYDEDYEEYDESDFEYEVDRDEAKEVIVESYIDLINGDKNNIVEFVKILNELEDEELISWKKIFENGNNENILKEHFRKNAMEWFIDEHYIMTEDDYKSHLADMYNDDKRLRENGE